MRTILTAAAALGCLMLGACGTSGITAGYSDNPAVWSVVTQHPRVNNGVTPADARAEMDFLARDCNRQIKEAASGPIQSAAGGAVIYGLGGLAGGAGGAKAGFGSSVNALDYGFYNAVPMAISGAINGTQVGAYSAATAKIGCLKDNWSISQKQKEAVGDGSDWSGTFVQVLTGGSKWGKK